jgi:OFA family oxalate/formate antiporter-like MFS transporter
MDARTEPPIRSNWPFDIRRLPFYYGWLIWGFSTLGILISIPGQTMGMAVFTDYLIEALHLSRTQLSMAYLIGTIGSSLFLTRAGRWYDRLGGRITVAASSAALALMVLFISVSDNLAMHFGGGVVVSFLLITLGYFGVRFLGQGILTSASRNVLLVWFEKRRGLVTSARGVFVSFGFSVAPLALAWLIARAGWREALWDLAFMCLVFAGLALVFLRDNPKSCGVLVDGHSHADQVPKNSGQISATLDQARRTPIFWLATLSLSMHSLLGTAVTFHIVSIFAEAGRSQTEAFAYFLPTAAFATVTNLLCGWLSDKRSLKPFMIMMLGSFVVGAVGLVYLQYNWGYLLLVVGFGIGGGLWSVTSNLAFIRNFGPLHLGEITGLCTAIMVFASAIGPALFSLGLDYFGSYAAAQWLCIAALALLLGFAMVVTQSGPNDTGKAVL